MNKKLTHESKALESVPQLYRKLRKEIRDGRKENSHILSLFWKMLLVFISWKNLFVDKNICTFPKMMRIASTSKHQQEEIGRINKDRIEGLT